MREMWRDARFGARMLAQSPGFTAAAVLCLALGIGANSAIFSVFNGIALRPLPYGTDESLVTIQTSVPGVTVDRNEVSEPELDDLRQRLSTVDPVAAYVPVDTNVIFHQGDEPVRVVTVVGDVTMVRTLGIRPMLGRDFDPSEGKPGKHLVVILSYHAWQSEYGGDPDVLGRTIVIDTEPHRVIGVMPEWFRFPFHPEADLFAPLAFYPRQRLPRENRYLSVVARMRPDTSASDVQEEMDALSAELRAEYPETYPAYAQFRFVAETVRDRLFAPARRAVIALMLAVAMVLLIACANVASLQLARGMTRSSEIAVRAALGASRWRIVRQLLAESLVLALLGGGGGLLVALWGVGLLRAVSPDALPHLRTIEVDSTVLLFTFGLSLVTGLIFGLAPAVHASRANLHSVLKDSARTTEGRRSLTLRKVLLASEISLALLLFLGAGMSIRSLHDMQRTDLGFESDQVMSMGLKLPFPSYPHDVPDLRRRFYGALFTRLAHSDPPIKVAAVSFLPLSGSRLTFTCELERSKPLLFEGQVRIVTPGYFSLMGIPLLEGRDFRSHGVEVENGVIIDDKLRRTYWGDANPVGEHIRMSGDPNSHPIIGVVGNVRHESVDSEGPPHLYQSYTARPVLRMTLVARLERPPGEIAAAVQKEVRKIDDQLAIYDIKTMNERVYDSLAVNRFATLLLGIFAGLALLLAVMGVYAVMSYTLVRRTREVAVRLALGADPRQIVAMLVRSGMKTAVVGIGAGILLAPLIGFGLSQLLFGVAWLDPLMFVGAGAVVGLSSALACVVVARRAATIEPALALRGE